jgi:hypothetical protein
VAVCELIDSCRLPHCERLPGSVMREPTVVADVQVPTSENGVLPVIDVLEATDGVVGIRTVVCRSELQAVASATVASSVSVETVLFTMVFVVRLRNCNRTHETGRQRLTNACFS